MVTIVDAAHSSNEGNSHRTIGRKTTSVSKGLWNKSRVSRWSLRIPNGKTCKKSLINICFYYYYFIIRQEFYGQKFDQIWQKSQVTKEKHARS